MKAKTLLLIAFLIAAKLFKAQGDYEWINAATGNITNEGLYTDAAGNTYTTGFIRGTVKFDTITLSTGNINKDELFVAKHSAAGKVIWAKKFTAASQGTESGYSVYADAAGNCYIAGSISVQTQFDSISVTPVQYEDAFVAKLSPSGKTLWVKLGSGNYQQDAMAVTTDQLNNVYVTGRFRFTATFGNLSITAKGTNHDVFVVKYDSNGTVQWVKQGGTDGGQDIGFAIVTDQQNNVYVAGHFEGSGNFDTVDVKATVFIAKYNTNGQLIWVSAAGDVPSCEYSSIGLDAAGNIYTAGYLSADLIFENDTLKPQQSDILVCKFKPDGKKAWVKKIGGTDNDVATSIRVDAQGNSYIGGYFYSKGIDFGPIHLNSYGDADAFIAKLDTDGNFMWVKQIGGKQQDGGPAGLYHSANLGIDAKSKVYFKTSVGSDPVYLGINKADSIANTGSLLFKTGMSLSFKSQNNMCATHKNGSIDLRVEGGVPPYTYTWSNGAKTEDIDHLPSGVYSVIVQDSKGMKSVAAIAITHPAFKTSILKTDISCNGLSDGTAYAQVLEGNAPYTFLWSNFQTTPQISNLTPGTYSVTITDSQGCSVYDSVTIAPAFNISFNTIFNCQDSTKNAIDLTVVQAKVVSPSIYCVPVAQCYFMQHEFLFKLNAFNDNKAACNENAYTYNNLQPAILLNIDSTHALDLQSNGADLGFGVWIDYNHDGDFNDTLEFVYASPNTSSFNNFHTTFKIPSFVTSCETRLRVRGKLNGTVAANESCANFSYGYSRDYTVEIQKVLSYLWSNGETKEDLVNIPKGTYSVKISNNNGCTVTDSATLKGPTLKVNGIVQPATCLLNDGSIQSQISGGMAPYTYSWSNSSKLSSIDHLAPGNFSVTVKDVNNCTANGDFVVESLCDPVWPGDTDNDKTADNNDLLAIGLYYGEGGIVRANASNAWTAQNATDWKQQQANGINLKYADCNGDGYIDLNDILAIQLNYGQKHSKQTPNNEVAPHLYFIIPKKSYISGEWIEAEIWAGKAISQISKMYGISFKVHLDPKLIELNTVTLTPQKNWFGNEAVALSKVLTSENRADAAITRINHQNAYTGFAKLADLKFQTVANLTNPAQLVFSFSDYKAAEADGTPVSLMAVSDSVTITAYVTNVDQLENGFSFHVFPNPFKSSTTLQYELKTSAAIEVKLYNALGACVQELVNAKQSAGRYSYSLGNEVELPEGVYVVKMKVNERSWFYKVVKEE